MRWLTHIMVSVALLAVLGGAIYWAFRPKPIPVEISSVTEGPFRATVEEDGRTRVRDRYVVSAPLAGRMLRVEIKAGDPVKANGRVATLMPSLPQLLDPRTRRELEERVGAAEATIQEADARRERAQAQLLQAQADVQRVRTLQQRGGCRGSAAGAGGAQPSLCRTRPAGRQRCASMQPNTSSIRPAPCCAATTSPSLARAGRSPRQ